MAGEVIKKLEEQVKEQLSCSICLDTYTEPKLLQCFHVYCRQCLVPLVVRDEQGKLGLTCPTCRNVTPILDRGVAGLQSAFQINRLLEIQDSVEKLKNPAAALEGAMGGTTIDTPTSNIAHCFVHVEEELKLHCETCRELVCMLCCLKGGKHHDHDCLPLKKAFERYKEEIASYVEPLEKQVTTIKTALAQLDRRREEITSQQAVIEDSVHVTFRQLQEVLSVRETKIINQLHKATQGKLKVLATQSDQIETTLAQLSSCLDFIGESLKTVNEQDVLTMKAITVNQAKKLTTPFQPCWLKTDTEADLVFSASIDMTASCQRYGQVISISSPDPSKCHVSGLEVTARDLGGESTAILHAVSYGGQPCEEHIKSLECELVSKVTGTRSKSEVEWRGQSQYKISYQPTIKGKHELRIQVEGRNVRGSPFSVAVKSPLGKIGTPILTIGGGMNEPIGLTINKKGEVLVTEEKGHCVSVFSPSGEKLRSFGTHGSGNGQYSHPCGIAVDAEGNILVADCWNHRIQKSTPEGHFLEFKVTEGNEPQDLQLYFPTDIAFNGSVNKVCALSEGNHHVQVLNSDLTFYRTFGKLGSGKGQFNSPRGIACDSAGKVYVADTFNHRIQVFTAEGKFLRMFGRRGQGKGEFSFPSRIALDTNGMVYVSDGNNNRVCVFTSEGQFILSFGRKGEEPEELVHPYGLAVDDTGVVYVCDNAFGRNCVQVF